MTNTEVFKNLPNHYVPGTAEDFIDEKGNYRIGMTFIIHGYHYKMYEKYYVKPNFSIKNIEPWLSDGRIYVKKEGAK